MGKCAEFGIDLCFFSPQGRFLARTVGEERGNVLLRQTQYRIADDPLKSTEYARYFILGKVYNARWVLERATRDHPQRVPVDQLKSASAQLASTLPLIEHVTNSEQLRGLEGEAAQRYFNCFDFLILQQHEEFQFLSRSRRPPLDKVNALLSFAYSLLANDCATALQSVRLNPMDFETGYGLITDVCLKRKIRNYVEMRMEDTSGYRIYIKDGVPLNRSDAEAIEHFGINSDLKTAKKADPEIDRKLRGDLELYPPFFWK